MREEKYLLQPRKVVGKQVRPKYSIISGTENPATMGATVYALEDGDVAIPFIPKSYHQGHGGIMHGGITAVVMDEVMGRALKNNCTCKYWVRVTANMNVDFLRPIKIGQKMRAFGHVDSIDGRKIMAHGIIVDEDNNIYAKATGLYIRVENIGTEVGIDKRYPLIETDDNDPEYI